MINIAKIQKEKPIQELLNFSIINIDKPSGPTSFQVSHFVMQSAGASKASHLGTLDPMVTGVLPVALGRACRLNDYLMHKNKTYVGIMHLHKSISEVKLKEEIKKFIGKIMQMPPLRSRVKRQLRQREILSFEILEIGGKDVLFKTEVQAGTYIRKLCDDIGKEIGGAHMLELRRTKAGIFDETDSVSLYELEEAFAGLKKGDESALRKILIPGEIIADILPVVYVKEQSLKKLLSGSPIFAEFLENPRDAKSVADGKFCVFCGEKFIGCYASVLEKEIIARPEFVFS